MKINPIHVLLKVDFEVQFDGKGLNPEYNDNNWTASQSVECMKSAAKISWNFMIGCNWFQNGTKFNEYWAVSHHCLLKNREKK